MEVIIPPSEIRSIIEKLSAYVIKNGPNFESKILEKERNNPKFSFLFPSDPYNSYYQKCLADFRKAGVDNVDDLLKTLKPKKPDMILGDQGFSSLDVSRPLNKASHVQPIMEPDPLRFILSYSSLAAVDLDIIKLTAECVAINGQHFGLFVSQREARNSQFDFLKPNHSLFETFMNLVDQYKSILGYSNDIKNKLHAKKLFILEEIRKRAVFVQAQRKKLQEDSEYAEKERLEYMSIDWNDFHLVETVDFGPSDKELDLPGPLNLSLVVSLSLLQRNELWNGNLGAVLLNNYGTQAIPLPTENALRKRSEQPVEDGVLPQGIKIKRNYIPKAQTSVYSQNLSYTPGIICPICELGIPSSQFDAHFRVELLDPKWKEQRDRYLSKHIDTNLITSGIDVSRNLQNMQRVRAELASLPEEEISRLVKEASLQAAKATVLWDGRIDTVSAATKEAMRRAKPELASQMNIIQRQQEAILQAKQLQREGE